MSDIDAIKAAAEYVGTINNMSGQMCQMKDGKPKLLLFDFGCPNCSEVASKIADEWGDALALLVNSAPLLLAELDAARKVVETARNAVEGTLFEARGMLVHAVAEYDWTIQKERAE